LWDWAWCACLAAFQLTVLMRIQVQLLLAGVGILVMDPDILPMVAIAACIGAGMSAILVGVRKAYGGSYSTLLAMQKISEVTLCPRPFICAY
jgi:hypothetical protein